MAMKNILVIDAHPDPSPDRFVHALGVQYAAAAGTAGHLVQVVRLSELQFPWLRTAEEFAGPPPATIEAQQQLFDLNDLDRAIALKRAIADQGLRCGQIVSTGYVTRYKDMDMWTAKCGDDRQWALFISANDSVQVRLCDDNEKIGLPACKVQPGTEGGTGLENVKIGNSAG